MIASLLQSGIIRKIRNRQDFNNLIGIYIRLAVLDITENYEFEEITTTGPVTQFLQNVSEYPKTGNGNIFLNQNNPTLTFVRSWFVWFQDSTPPQPGSTGFVIKNRQIRVVEPMAKIPGIPTYYAINGNTIVVGYNPNIAYFTQMRYQIEHPFPVLTGNDTIDNQNLMSADIRIPRDWQEIVEYAAAEKILRDVGQNEVANSYHQLLFGYKDVKNNTDVPGLIKQRLSEQQRHGEYNERQLRPQIRRYQY